MVPASGRSLFACFIFLALFACAVPAPPGEDLVAVTRDFAMRLRWLDLNGAARHLPEGTRQEFIDRLRADRDLRITDVRIVRIDNQENRARVELEMEYYRLPSLTVKTWTAEQQWVFLPGDRRTPGRWTAAAGFPPWP